MQLYPSWTARDNYAVHGKKKKKKKDKNPGDNSGMTSFFSIGAKGHF